MNDEHELRRIDEWLGTEPHAAAPVGLTDRIVREVQRHLRRPSPLPFPWRRFGGGLLAAVVACVLCGWLHV